MNRFRIASLVAGVAALSAVAHAQTPPSTQNNVTTQLTGPTAPGEGAVTAFGFYMSPYTGTVNGTQETFNCVDFYHDVTIGEVWTSNITNIGAMAADVAAHGNASTLVTRVRDGMNDFGAGDHYASATAVVNTYEEAAWLSTEVTPNPATDDARSIAIQTAIWYLTSKPTAHIFINDYPTDVEGLLPGTCAATATVTAATTACQETTGYWINEAQTQYNAQTSGFYNNFYVLTDVNACGWTLADSVAKTTCYKKDVPSAQEFIYHSTPEPATVALFATGLVPLVGFAKRRRRSNSAE